MLDEAGTRVGSDTGALACWTIAVDWHVHSEARQFARSAESLLVSLCHLILANYSLA
jgi:hypothetical protein